MQIKRLIVMGVIFGLPLLTWLAPLIRIATADGVPTVWPS